MAGRRSLFRKSELERAIQVVQRAGVSDARIEFTAEGGMAIVISSAAKSGTGNSFDQIIGGS
jgi:hypothetical protein